MLARVNLVPQKPLAERLKILVPLLLTAIIALVLVSVYLHQRLLTTELAQASQEVEKIGLIQARAKAEMGAMQQLAGELETLRKRQSLLREEVEKIEAIRMEKKPYSLALATIAGSLPGTLKCDKITFRNGRGMIEGVATNYRDLSSLIGRLREKAPFGNVSLDNVDKVTGNSTEPLHFRMKVTLN
jgi:Tfp pilus assembly protein PilN